MRQIVTIVCTLGITMLSFAQDNTRILNRDEENLLKINHQFIRNFLNNDTIEHNRIIHPLYFLFIGTDGKLADRIEYMKGWAHGYDKNNMPEFGLQEEQVRVFGDMALIVAKTRDKTLKDGKWVTGETRYTDTYLKEKGEWKCVQVQLTKIATTQN